VLTRLLSLFSPRERARLVGLLFLMALGAALEVVGIGLVVPVVAAAVSPDTMLANAGFRRLYEWSGTGSPQTFALVLLCTFLGLIVVKNVYLGVVAHLQFRLVYAKYADVSRRLFSGYLMAPYVLHLQRHSADVTRNLVTEVNGLFAGVLLPLLSVGAEAMLMVLLVGVLIMVIPQEGLAVLMIGAVVVVPVYLGLRSRLARHGTERAERSGKRIKAIGDALGALKEIKVLGREPFFIESFAESNERYLDASAKFAFLGLMPRLLIETLSILLLVGAILAVLAAGVDVTTAAPSVVLLCLVALRLMPAATRILAAAGSIRFYLPTLEPVQRDLAALESLLDTHADRSNPTRAPSVLRRQISVEKVVFSYPGARRPALDDVTLEIRAGEVSALVGASGAGKSTLADLILAVFEPHSGRILVDGADIRADVAAWRRSVGYVPQTVHLLDSSVRCNVALGLAEGEIDDRWVWQALQAAQIDSLVRALPDTLDEKIGEQGIKLSGGQRQRLGIARALYGDPQVLILDEATSALDTQTERAIADTLLDMRRARTVIVIAHRLDTIKRCDQLYFLAEGRLLGVGTYDELVSANSRFAALVGEATL
jgi:ABC-type multidrug transport system fused ATPase/permease subunit